MSTIEGLVQAIKRDLGPEFERRLRAALADADREWLIDELVRLTLAANGMAKGRATPATDVAAERARAAERFIAENGGRTREHLVAEGYINATAPPNGTGLLTADDRIPAGQALLTHAKDLLFGLLFGDGSTETAFDRVQ